MKKRGIYIKEALLSGAEIANNGALCVKTGAHTGRSPNAKHIVVDDMTRDTVDWSSNNSITEKEFDDLDQGANWYIKVTREDGNKRFYSQLAYCGHDDSSKILVKFICERPEHALFVCNMFDPVDDQTLKPDLSVVSVPDYKKQPIVAMNMTKKSIIISGTRYAGEIKKSVFTYMNFILPNREILPMHCSVNTSYDKKNPAVFFGLSGTGKTTLSADENRCLLGDDEHGWSKTGLFNFENGCYAKTINLTEQAEPQIWKACSKFGAILENVPLKNGKPDFSDTSLSQNGRGSYPLTSIENAISQGRVLSQPNNVIMLTCDAFGVLPAVAHLSPEEAHEQFLLGYTAKVAGTEVGVTEPIATFSPCFGAPFMPLPPKVYADLLVKRVKNAKSNCWLVNTGWFGGVPGRGNRISLKITRHIINLILEEKLINCEFTRNTLTGLNVPTTSSIEEKYVFPEKAWSNIEEYQDALNNFIKLVENQKNK